MSSVSAPEHMVIRMNDYVEERLPAPAELGRADSRALTPGAIYRQDGYAVVGSGGLLRQERVELNTHTRDYYEKRGQADASALLGEAGVAENSDREFYRLTEDHTYYVEFEEDLDVPEDHVGLVLPQENLLRAGVMSHASPVGADESDAEALLHVKANNVLIDVEATIGELVTFESVPTGGGAD